MAEIVVGTLHDWPVTWFRGKGRSLATSMKNIREELEKIGITEKPNYAVIMGRKFPVRDDRRIELVRRGTPMSFWRAHGITSGSTIDITFVFIPPAWEYIDIDAETGYDIYYDSDTEEYVSIKEAELFPEEVERQPYLEMTLTCAIETDGGHEPFKAPEVDIRGIVRAKGQKTLKDFAEKLESRLKDYIKNKFDGAKLAYIWKEAEKGKKVEYDQGAFLYNKIDPKATKSVIKTGIETKITKETESPYLHIHIQIKGRRPIEADVV